MAVNRPHALLLILFFSSCPLVFAEGLVPFEAEFSNKIVYTTDAAFNKDVLMRDCEGRGGAFNECGSVCDDRKKAAACVTVCAFTCEFKHGNKSKKSWRELIKHKVEKEYVVSVARVTMEDTRRARYHFDFSIESRHSDSFKIVSMRLYDGPEVTELIDQLGPVNYWFPRNIGDNSQEAIQLKKDQEFRMYFLKPDDHCQNIALESKDRKFQWVSNCRNSPGVSYFSELRYFSKFPVGVGSLEGSDSIVEGVPVTSSQHGPSQDLIPKHKKKLIKRSMTVHQAVEILGPGYVAKSSGTGGVAWYFDDGSSIAYSIWTEFDAVPNWRGIEEGDNPLSRDNH